MFSSIASILEVIGTLTISYIAYQIYKFIDLYFLKESTLPRYLHPKNRKAYALVTGSSDGIGLETAKALQSRGFNILLHGRNPSKLSKIAENMNGDYPSQKVVVVAADATDPTNAVPKILKAVKEVEAEGGKLTVLINNIGGASMFGISEYATLKEIPQDTIVKQIGLNAMFPTLLTSALLPNLIANAPALVVNIGSFAGVFGMPYLTTYAPSKAFNHTFSVALASEMKVLKADVEVLGIVVGSVKTSGNPHEELNFATLAPDEMARSILERVGCGQNLVTGNWKQCLPGIIMGLMPASLREKVLGKEMTRRAEGGNKDK
jgi:17beta-estradiol 17-dehydrogenase / very-long-chain 3-oxoacyl-CoA reductase